MDAERAFLSFVADVMSVPPESLSLATTMATCPAWDSVMHIRLVLEIGARYGVDIPLETIPTITTLADFFRCVQAEV